MPNSHQPNGQDSPELMKSFLELQTKKIQNEGKELQIREREIESNEKLALRSIELQSDLLKSRPKEARKSITRLAYIAGSIIIVMMLFLGILVLNGHKDFANEILYKGSYVAVALLSYLAGRKGARRAESRNNDGADVVQEID